MVEAGAKEVTEEQVVEALDAAHAAIKQIVAAIDDLAKEAGKKKLKVAKKEIGHDFYREVEEKVLVPLTEAMRIRGKLENYEPRRPGARRARRVDARRRGRAQGRSEGDLQGAEGKGAARRGARARRPPRRPQVRRGPADLDRDQRPAAHARLGGLHARRDAGARHLHARHRRRCAEDRELRRARRGRASCSTTTSRRSRSAKSAFLRGPGRREVGHGALAERALDADAAGRGAVPLHRARRVRHPRVERVLVDGVGLRRIAGDDGRRRAAQGAGRRHRDGPGDGREDRQVRGAQRHRGRRGSLRRHGLQGRRHRRRHHRAADGHQGRRHHHRGDAEGARAGAPRPAAHPRQDAGSARRATPDHLGLRAAHRHDPDPGGQDPRRHRARAAR